MVGDDQIDAQCASEVGGGVGGRAAVGGDDHGRALLGERLHDRRGQAVAVDEAIRESNEGLDAHQLEPGGQHGGGVDAVGVVVGEDRHLLLFSTRVDETFDGSGHGLQQLRIVRVAAHAGEEVQAILGGSQTARVHHLDHGRVDVADALEECLWRARDGPPDVSQPPSLAHGPRGDNNRSYRSTGRVRRQRTLTPALSQREREFRLAPMPIVPAERMKHIGQETAFEVLVKARALEATGRSVVHLEIGEPDFDTPGHIVSAAQQALEGGFTHYGPGAGLPELRLAVARYLRTWRGLDVVVLSDEIYSRILYTRRHESIATLDGMLDRTILLDGWSKTWAMTGWRLGFGVFPTELMPHVERLISNSVSCTASFAQQAAIAALDGPQEAVTRMVDEFTIRRAAILAGLNALPGVRCLEPDGAFYAFPNITGTGFASHDLADRLLEEAGVACLSGTAFGG